MERVANPRRQQFGFTAMWETDALEILRILTKLRFKDERMQEEIDLVISKQNEHGRWKLDETFNHRFLVNIKKKMSQANG